MSLFRKIRNALSLLCKFDLHEFIIRARIALGQIDLKIVSTEELNLSSERSNFYSNSGGSQLDNVLASFNINSHDAIIDLGCGKGGALITLAKYPFSKITGIEISEELVGIARKNLNKLRINNVETIVSDAVDYIELDVYNYVYFFNPFPCAIMRSVIGNINKSLARVPRKVTIIYLNPVCHETVIADSPFVKQREFEHHMHKYYIYSNKP